MRELCQFSSTFFTWSFYWILLNSYCPPWTCTKEILCLDDSKWNVSSLIYILPSHLLIHFRSNLYFWNVYFRGFVITFSQGHPVIFHIESFTHNKLLHESSSNWWWFATLYWWFVVALCLISNINDNLIQQP